MDVQFLSHFTDPQREITVKDPLLSPSLLNKSIGIVISAFYAFIYYLTCCTFDLRSKKLSNQTGLISYMKTAHSEIKKSINIQLPRHAPRQGNLFAWYENIQGKDAIKMTYPHSETEKEHSIIYLFDKKGCISQVIVDGKKFDSQGQPFNRHYFTRLYVDLLQKACNQSQKNIFTLNQTQLPPPKGIYQLIEFLKTIPLFGVEKAYFHGPCCAPKKAPNESIENEPNAITIRLIQSNKRIQIELKGTDLDNLPLTIILDIDQSNHAISTIYAANKRACTMQDKGYIETYLWLGDYIKHQFKI